MFWFRGWFSERPPVERTSPWTREQVGGDSPVTEKPALVRTIRLPWFRMERRGVLPALTAALVVAAGYWVGALCSLTLCGIVVRLTWIPAVILLLVEVCCFWNGGWSGMLFRIGFLAYAVFLLAAESDMSFFAWYYDLFWLTHVVPLLVPLLVGAMILHRQKRWIGAAGAWLLLFSAVAMVTFNAVNNWKFVGFFRDIAIRW